MFYVGQKVVALKSSDYYKGGNEYVIKDIKACDCGFLYLCIGVICEVPFHKQVAQCVNCGHRYPSQKYRYHNSTFFAPIEEYSDSMSIAMQLVQEIDQTDKQKIFNPKRETVKK